LLKIDQRVIELTATKTGLLDVLSLFTGETYTVNTVFTKPVLQLQTIRIFFVRIEPVSKAQQLLGGKMIKAKNLPKTSFFFKVTDDLV
jgi:hypothetical protein